jgi:uncharacterized protein
MKIYLPELKLKQGEAVDYRFEEDLSACFDDFTEGGKLDLSLTAFISGDQVMVNGTLEVSTLAVCSRCLEQFSQYFKTDFSESFTILKTLPAETNSFNEAVEAANMLTISGDYLYLDEYIRQLIILAQEYNPVCDPGCKGLCAGCGQDLNKSSCRCNSDFASQDVRFLKLKELELDSEV